MNESQLTDIEEQATEWALSIDEKPSVYRSEAFQSWISQSEAHQVSFTKVTKLLSICEGFDIHQFKVKSNAGISKLWRPLVAMAASVFLVVTIVVMQNQVGPNVTDLVAVNTLSYQTDTAEHKVIELEDGSCITLSGQSQVLVSYTDQSRTIALASGEALFEVAKDPERPFIVQGVHGNVQALGTIFNVKNSINRMSISVLEGLVQVDSTVKHSSESFQLGIGYRADISNKGELLTRQPFEVSDNVDWLSGRLNYHQIALEDVVADVKRYSPLNIYIQHADIKELTFTGSIMYEELDDWINALPLIYPVEILRNEDTVVISKKS